MKKFLLRVWYANGSSTLLVDEPDLIAALSVFQKLYKERIPDFKEYGFPVISKAELIPVFYDTTQEI